MIDNIFSEEIELFEKFKRDFYFVQGKTTYEYWILDEQGEYALLYSPSRAFYPYLVVWLLDKTTGIWQQGHYFEKLTQAIEYFNKELNI